MVQLTVPVICVIIGEGASGGALGIGVGDRVLMLENTWYSVISPESCSSILWRNWDHKVEAAEALKLTAEDMLKNKLIDGIIKEPMGGAHRDHAGVFESVSKEIQKHLKRLMPMDADTRIARASRSLRTWAWSKKSLGHPLDIHIHSFGNTRLAHRPLPKEIIALQRNPR